MERLVLFDIDETITASDGAGRRAIGRALNDIYGIDASKITLSMSGKTDPQILREIFKAVEKNDEEIDEMLGRKDEMFNIYLDLLEEELKNAKYFIVHQGVVELLESLSAHSNGYLGLLTGNIERGARLKLEQFGLNKYFPLGAYGSDHASRNELPAIATLRAKEHFKVDFRPEQVVIIGDSIYDVLCAKGYGARSIAVNTGKTSKADLEEQKPDYLFANLTDTHAVIEAIFA
ncbi:MAG: HAD family hydrolase [Candidatus Melainabacteria bacterium]|mgnify:CR=1 FL=1|nr:HAD family hydrolase [Candidatus Melainabacteria bacterium]